MKRTNIVSICILSLVISSCAHSPENFVPDASRADQQCTAQHWDSLGPKVACFDTVEAPVVQRDMPFAVAAFQTYSAKRSAAAGEFDHRTETAKAAWLQFYTSVNQANAVLAAHEPLYLDKASTLSQELKAINFDSACQQPKREDKMLCFGAVGRPIWERNAPGTLAYFDQFQDTRLALARQYDASGSGDLYASALAQYKQQADAAARSFYADARQSLQAAEAQKAADREQARERSAQSLKVLGDFVGALAAATVGAAVVVAESRAAAPAPAAQPFSLTAHCQTNTYGRTTYTDCN